MRKKSFNKLLQLCFLNLYARIDLGSLNAGTSFWEKRASSQAMGTTRNGGIWRKNPAGVNPVRTMTLCRPVS